jgi:nucleotide-binding universal stress UspA family protein
LQHNLFTMAEVIIPFDFSTNAIAALDQALLLAQVNGAELEVLHITNDRVVRDYPDAWECTPGDKARLLEKIKGTLDQRRTFLQIDEDVKVTVLVKESSSVAAGIHKRAMASNAVLLVLGTHGMSGFKQSVVGSNTSEIINSALFPVLAIPPDWQAQKIQFGIVAAELKEVEGLAASIRQWSRFLHIHSRVVQFTSLPEILDDFKDRHIIGGLPVSIEKSELADTLASNLFKYTHDLQETILIMYVHERKIFERIFDFSLTERTARIIQIPLLAIPKES